MFIIGLDNGIYVKSDKRQLTRADLPIGITYPFENDYNDEIEIAYWRKCWGIRNSIINYFGWRFSAEDQWKFFIEKPEQVLELIEIIASWLNEEKWEDEGSSIWSYKEIRSTLIQNIINFALIYTFLEKNPDCYLVFYDSY